MGEKECVQDTLRRAGARALEHWCGFLRGFCNLPPLSYCFPEGIRTEISASFVSPRTKLTARTLCLREKCLTVNVKGGTKMIRHEMAGPRGLGAIPQTDVNLSVYPTVTHFFTRPWKGKCILAGRNSLWTDRRLLVRVRRCHTAIEAAGYIYTSTSEDAVHMFTHQAVPAERRPEDKS